MSKTINKNDFVVVNGKKYYAEGGIKGPIDPEVKAKLIKALKNSWKIPKDGGYNMGTRFIARTPSVPSENIIKSKDAGKSVYDRLSDEKKEQIKIRTANYINWLQNTDEGRAYAAQKGIDSSYYKYYNPSTFYNDEHSKIINGSLYDLLPNQVIPNDDGTTDKIAFGENQSDVLSRLAWKKNYSKVVPEEIELLKSKGYNEYFDPTHKNYISTSTTRQQYPGIGTVYSLYKGNGDSIAEAPTKVFIDENNNIHEIGFTPGKKNDPDGGFVFRDITELGPEEVQSDKSYRYNFKNPNSGKYVIEGGNSNGWGVDDKEKQAYGGQLNRYYADGGAMGQIPLGEQEPEGYNMVGAGGMHEENPMGGVPYGVNQDGSQNMVEQGEVSMGDNVFSDRSQLSPELCQQLGLPEGTTPAQAMQQIEQLYEQGQLSDEEFQEVQQIIFQDQEAQKENMGGSYQQGEVGGPGVPNEGIDPNMGGMPMDPMAMQGGQPEGITPDMIQGQGGFGGY